MNARLFNDNGCETPNEAGRKWQDDISETVRSMVKEAVENNVSLRDLQALVIEEISVTCAEERLRKGIKERAAERARKAQERDRENALKNMSDKEFGERFDPR